MSDLPAGYENDAPESGAPPQGPLDQAASMFRTPEGRQYAEEAATRINDFVTQKNIADANTRAGQAFEGNLADMRQNLVGMVQSDPTAVHLGMDLAGLGVRSMVGTVPDADPAHADAITGDMHRAIAAAAVRSAAEQSEPLARQLLGDDRIAGALGDDLRHLGGYVDAQAAARKIDNQAAQMEAGRQAEIRANQRAFNYLDAVKDDGEQLRFPEDWAKRVMADPALPPSLKASLFDTYGRLMTHGDVASSDPLAVRMFVGDIASGERVSPADLLAQAGDTLTLADAKTLADFVVAPKNKEFVRGLDAHLQAAQRQLAAPENGPAGQIALDNFTSWILGAVRGGIQLDPQSPDYILQGNRMQLFQPQAADYADQVIGRWNRRVEDMDWPSGRPGVDDRMSLDQIFSGNPEPPPGDKVIRNNRRIPPVAMPELGKVEK